MHYSIVAVVLTIGGAIAVPSSKHVLHEKRDHVPTSWIRKYKATADALPVRIGLTQNNLEQGHHMLMDVSDHNSPNYGRYYTAEQIHNIFAPAEESVNTVWGWLEQAGIAKERISQSVNKQWLQFDASVAELEGLVKAEYYVFEQLDTGVENTACDAYHLPEHIIPHVDYITPGIKIHHPVSRNKRNAALTKRGVEHKLPPLILPLPATMPEIQQKNAGSSPLSQCDSVITPACIKAMYNITQGTLAAPGNELGVFEDLGDHYSQQDLNLFFKAVYSKYPQGTHPELRGIDGATGPNPVSSAGAESDLDFQISYPIIHPQGSVLFQTDDDVTENNYVYAGFLNNFLDAIDGSYCSFSSHGETGNSPLDPPYPDPKAGGYKGALQCGVYEPTNVITISYGGSEGDLPISYQRRQCAEYMKLGMQGISVCAASGDYGVASFPGGKKDDDPSPNGCYANNVFNPDSIANCPYVTSLGATFIPAGGSAAKDQEIAVTRFASGGGFSNIFLTPSYQKSAVQSYLTKYPPPYPSYSTKNNVSVGAGGGLYNIAGRGYPDFAAVGDHVLIYYRGNPVMIGGTSASSPAFAAILTRINEERIAAGKSTIGFVNPILYANPSVFHDITQGTNPGCGTNGFSAQPGWDPLTGLGTPNYPAMLELFMAQP